MRVLLTLLALGAVACDAESGPFGEIVPACTELDDDERFDACNECCSDEGYVGGIVVFDNPDTGILPTKTCQCTNET